MKKNVGRKFSLKYLSLLLPVCILFISANAQTDSLETAGDSLSVVDDTLGAMVDTLAGVQEMEFQLSVEDQARGDIAALRQFIIDSLQFIYDEMLLQQKDSLATLFNNQITDILNQNSMETTRLNKTVKNLRDSLIARKQVSPVTKDIRQHDPLTEAKYFQYEKLLKRQKIKSRGGFLILSSEIEDIHPFQIAELEKYIDRFFPDARCDSVQDYLTQIYINKQDWARAELSIIKFIFFYPESPLFEEIKTVRARIFETEKAYKNYSTSLKNIVDSTTVYPDIQTRYFELVKLLKDFPDPAVKVMFVEEAQKYLELYPFSENSSLVCLWLAQTYSANQRAQSAFITYNRLMIFYPDSPEMTTALYQSARIQEKDFEEFDAAIETYNSFIDLFPEDTLTAYAHKRIAKIADGKQKNWEKAIEEYQITADLFQAAEKTKKSTAALMRKAVIQANNMNMIQGAIETYLSIEERFPGTLGAQKAIFAAGQLYQKDKQFELAIAQYMSIYEKYPDAENVLDALDTVVDIYNSELGDHDKTVETLNLIITNYPDSKSAAKAAKLLKKLQKTK